MAGGDRHVRPGLLKEPALPRNRRDQGAEAHEVCLSMFRVIENVDQGVPGLGKPFKHFLRGIRNRNQLSSEHATSDRHLDGAQHRAHRLDGGNHIRRQTSHQRKWPPLVDDRAGMDHVHEVERAVVFRTE